MTPTGEIHEGCVVTQTIRVARDSFSGLSFMVSTYARRNTSRLVLRLFQSPSIPPVLGAEAGFAAGGTLVAEETVEAAGLIDNREFEFYFEPRQLSEGDHYVFSVHSMGAGAGNGVTLWLEDNTFDSPQFPVCTVAGAQPTGKRLHLRMLYSPPLANPDGPLAILFSPVTQCNLNCTHCISRETRSTLHSIGAETKDEIAALARSGTLERLTAHYSGDIFFIDQKYGGALDYIFGLEVDLFLDSHGNHMSKELGLRLLNSKLRRINFSLDAATEATHRSIRRGSRPLSEIMDNVRLFMELRSQLGKTAVQVTVSMTLMHRNLHEVPGMVDLACALGVDAVNTRHLEAYTDDMESESLFLHQGYYNGMINEIAHYARKKGMTLSLPDPFVDIPPQRGHRHCAVAWESLTVLGNGDVMACCVPSSRIGRVQGSSIREIWNGPIYQEFRRRVNSQDPPELCKACPIFRLENNPDSFLFNRVRKNLPTLFDELTQSMHGRTGGSVASLPAAMPSPHLTGRDALPNAKAEACQFADWFAGPFRKVWQKNERRSAGESGLVAFAVGATLESDERLTLGLTIQGGPMEILVRAAGPALKAAGVRSAMTAPKLSFYEKSTLVHQTQGWSAALVSICERIGAHEFEQGSQDAATVNTIGGQHTICVHGRRSGTVLAEIFAAGSFPALRIVNLSARVRVGAASAGVFVNFTPGGSGERNLLIRAVGPTLSKLDIMDFLALPKISLFGSNHEKIAESSHWDPSLTSVFSRVGAFGFESGSRDAAMLVNLAAGEAYTIEAGSCDHGAGLVNIEIFELPEVATEARREHAL